MKLDSTDIPAGSRLDADICIIGAGPAGLSMARYLLGKGLSLVVLESGGGEPDPATDVLSSARVDRGIDMYPDCRYAVHRALGGTSWQWDVAHQGAMHAHIAPYPADDFAARDWVPQSGWGIDQTALAPWVQTACRLMGVPGAERGFDVDAWTDPSHPLPRPTGRQRDLAPMMINILSSTQYRDEIPARLKADPDARLITRATVVELQTDSESTRIHAVVVARPDGSRWTLQARQVLLATGGYEVPRLLLASRRHQQEGIGNRHGLVGRYLMDRQLVNGGLFVPSGPDAWRRLAHWDEHTRADGSLIRLKYRLSPELRRRERLLSALLWLTPREAPGAAYRLGNRLFGRGTTARSRGIEALATLMAGVRGRRLPEQLPRQLFNLVRDLDDVVFLKKGRAMGQSGAFNRDAGGWSRLDPQVAHRRFMGFEVSQLSEQSAHPDNRITLTDELDALGMPRSRIHMELREQDLRSARRTSELLGNILKEQGLGTLHTEDRQGDPLYFQLTCHHPMGTTRMSPNPRTGVVDTNGRIHGIHNLRIVSSSIFPTGGCVPPTLTVVACGLRSADQALAELPSSAAASA